MINEAQADQTMMVEACVEVKVLEHWQPQIEQIVQLLGGPGQELDMEDLDMKNSSICSSLHVMAESSTRIASALEDMAISLHRLSLR